MTIGKLKIEAFHAPSGVAFTKTSDGSYLSVKFDVDRFNRAVYQWTYQNRAISESKADQLFSELVS